MDNIKKFRYNWSNYKYLNFYEDELQKLKL